MAILAISWDSGSGQFLLDLWGLFPMRLIIYGCSGFVALVRSLQTIQMDATMMTDKAMTKKSTMLWMSSMSSLKTPDKQLSIDDEDEEFHANENMKRD